MLRSLPGPVTRSLSAIAIATLGAAVALPTAAADIFVDTLDGSGTSDGLCSLIEAIEAAEADAPFGDCPAGSGWDHIRFVVSGTISLTRHLPIAGESLSILGPGADDLIVDGGAKYHLFELGVDGGHQSFVISGITLTQGRTKTSGGAVSMAKLNHLTISDSRLTDNYSPSGGGAVSVPHNVPLVPNVHILFERSTFEGNIATGAPGGGAVRIGSGADVVIVDCTFSGNETLHANAGGGGIAIQQSLADGSARILRSTISGNSVQDEGGGLSLFGSKWRRSTLRSHTAPSPATVR